MKVSFYHKSVAVNDNLTLHDIYGSIDFYGNLLLLDIHGSILILYVYGSQCLAFYLY